MNYYILTKNELTMPSLIYYTGWYLASYTNAEVNVSSALKIKTAVINHKLVKTADVQNYLHTTTENIRNNLGYTLQREQEYKCGDNLFILPLETIEKVVATIVSCGASVRSWSKYLIVWLYITNAYKISSKSTEISQPVMAKNLGLRLGTVNSIVLDLINMKLIERVGTYSAAQSRAYMYKIPKELELFVNFYDESQ